jgi:hypothetical protein
VGTMKSATRTVAIAIRRDCRKSKCIVKLLH